MFNFEFQNIRLNDNVITNQVVLEVATNFAIRAPTLSKREKTEGLRIVEPGTGCVDRILGRLRARDLLGVGVQKFAGDSETQWLISTLPRLLLLSQAATVGSNSPSEVCPHQLLKAAGHSIRAACRTTENPRPRCSCVRSSQSCDTLLACPSFPSFTPLYGVQESSKK